MNSELYLKKAILLLSRGENEKAVENLQLAINYENDILNVTQARCMLGEYFFINNMYDKAFQQLMCISEQAEELEAEYDDLLSEEINRAQTLIEIIERYKLV